MVQYMHRERMSDRGPFKIEQTRGLRILLDLLAFFSSLFSTFQSMFDLELVAKQLDKGAPLQEMMCSRNLAEMPEARM